MGTTILCFLDGSANLGVFTAIFYGINIVFNIPSLGRKTSLIQDTLNLSKCADISTNTKADRKGKIKSVRYHLSHVM